jgi:hypothetical protein
LSASVHNERRVFGRAIVAAICNDLDAISLAQSQIGDVIEKAGLQHDIN